MASSHRIRKGGPGDGPALLRLIHALARFEKLEGPDAAAEARLLEHGFGERPRFETWFVEVEGSEHPVGYAVLFETYSTFLAKPTLYLEDLFVLEDWRRRGLGKALLDHCVGLAEARGCGRMEWTCLDWNRKAQVVYEGMGARRMNEWLLYRLTDFGARPSA